MLLGQRHSRALSKTGNVDAIDLSVATKFFIVLVEAWQPTSQPMDHDQGEFLFEPVLVLGREVNGVDGDIFFDFDIHDFVPAAILCEGFERSV